MKKLKKNQGITLIALVITIIVLLLLAGISIQSLTGSGIFEKAKEAIEKHKYEVAFEKVKLAVNASYDETGNINNKYLYENLDNIDGKEELTENKDNEEYIVKVDGYYFLVSKTGEVKPKDIEIADGGIDSGRDQITINSEQYNNLLNTVASQGETIEMQSNQIRLFDSKLANLQAQIDDLNPTQKANLLGSVEKNNPVSFDAKKYSILVFCTKTFVSTWYAEYSAMVSTEMLSSTELTVIGGNSDTSTKSTDRSYCCYTVTNSNAYLVKLSISGTSYIDNENTKTWVYGIK